MNQYFDSQVPSFLFGSFPTPSPPKKKKKKQMQEESQENPLTAISIVVLVSCG